MTIRATRLGAALTAPLLASLVLSACIKREPRAAEPTPQAVVETKPTGTGALPPDKLPPTGRWGKVQGEDVLGGKGMRAFMAQGATDRIEAKYMPATDQPFTEFIRAKVVKPSKNEWDVQLRASNETTVEDGDVMLATVYFRTEWVADESGEGKTEAVFELSSDPWTKSVTYPARASAEWQRIYIPFIADGTYRPGEAQFAFRMGYDKQTVDLGGIKVENFKKELVLADLPKTKRSYPGIEPDAPWRAEAQARIDEYRKENLQVAVRNAAGAPVPGAQVKVTLKRHSFRFGTAAPADLLLGKTEPKFHEVLTKYFNTVTLENDLKWQPLAGDWGKAYTIERALDATKWLHQHGLALRGHVLVWPGWQNLPAKLKLHEKNPALLKKEVEAHIREVAGAMKGKVIDWDVLNEPFTNHDLMDILGYEVMADWFRIARDVEPNAHLYINDFAILSGGGGTTAHRDHYEKMIQILADQNAPFDGIGFQGHFGTGFTSPMDVYKLLERYGKFNKKFAVTEYDLLIDDEELASTFMHDFYTICFSHRLMESLIMWGFWDKRHWHKVAPLYRDDWSEKPAAKMFQHLLEEEWNTKVSGTTDDTGSYTARGFLGDYEVTVTAEGKTKSVKTKLAKSSSATPVQLVVQL